MLEERLLLSAGGAGAPPQTTVWVLNQAVTGLIGPYTLTNPAPNPGSVIFLGGTSPNTPGVDWGNVPTKSVTFTNTSNPRGTIYPFLYSSNDLKIYDPIDVAKDQYRLYIGYEQNGNYILGLPPGETVTVSVPLVFWNAARVDEALDGPNLLPAPAKVNTFNPYQFFYTGSTYITKQGVLSSTDNAVLMYYKQNAPLKPNDPSPAAPGQLAEWTIRDQGFLTKVDAYDRRQGYGSIPASQLTTLVNYDVSYVDDLTAPVAMHALNVPVPIQYIQNGIATTQQNTTTITLGGGAAPLLRLLTTVFPYRATPWQVKYNAPNKTTEIGTVTNVSNSTLTVVSSGPVSGLPTGAASYVFYTNAVTQNYGWTGANNELKQMQNVIRAFTSHDAQASGLGHYFGGLGWPQYYNPDPNALIKIPSGASILINSPLTTKSSPFDINHYLLTSGNNGRRYLYNAHEELDPSKQPTNKGDKVTFKVTTIGVKTEAALAAIKLQGGTWVLADAPNTAGTNPIGTIDVKTIDPAKGTMTVTLAESIPNLVSGYSYLIVAPPTDPYAHKITNLWYSWANYYVKQFSNTPPPPDFSAKVSADSDSPTDTRILTLTTARPDLHVGMSLSGNGISSLTTILRIATVDNQQTLYLSTPVPAALNGQTVTFQVSNPQPIKYSDTPGLNTGLINPDAFGKDAAFAKAFGASVYELMSIYSTVPVKHTDLPLEMDLVYEAIGGNVGFLPAPVKDLKQITADVRDLGKSVLRGVPDFLAYPDQQKPDSQWHPGLWYPPPSKHTDGTDYNVFNLDPFVWFVHQRLGLSGYGFSFDDDVADVGANGASALSVDYSSGADRSPLAQQWFASTPWGAVTAMASIAPYHGSVPAFQGKSVLTIDASNTKQHWQLSADDLKNGLIGAYISTTAQGINIPPKTNLLAGYDSNALQFVLSSDVTPTINPIPVTFTGYLPKALRGARRTRG